MANLIKWINPNPFGEGQRVYRADGPLDTSNLPEPIATIPNNITEYLDEEGTVGNYYIVSVFRGNLEKYSENISQFIVNQEDFEV